MESWSQTLSDTIIFDTYHGANKIFCVLSTCQYVEFYRSAFLTSLLYISMDKADGLITEVMDDKKVTHQQATKGAEKTGNQGKCYGAHHKWNPTTPEPGSHRVRVSCLSYIKPLLCM
jgi:hypothetical protein